MGKPGQVPSKAIPTRPFEKTKAKKALLTKRVQASQFRANEFINSSPNEQNDRNFRNENAYQHHHDEDIVTIKNSNKFCAF